MRSEVTREWKTEKESESAVKAWVINSSSKYASNFTTIIS